MPRVVRYPEIGNHVKIQKKYVPTDLQNAHFAAAAATDWLTCEVLRLDTDRLDYISDLVDRLDVMDRIERLLPRASIEAARASGPSAA